MVDFSQPVVAIPGGASFQIPKVDFSGLASLPDQFFQGTQQRHALDIQNAFKGGLPTDANGNPDYAAAANKLYSLGDMAGANTMMQTALSRQALTNAGNLSSEWRSMNSPPAQPALDASQSGTPNGLSLGASINNPGDLRDKLADGSTNTWVAKLPGYQGSKNGFAVFDTPDNGIAAADANLSSYGSKGLNTPAAIANTWAPKGDGANNPAAYGQRLASALGIGVNDPINLKDPAIRAKVRNAMFGPGMEGTNQGPFAGNTQQQPASQSVQAGTAPGAPQPPLGRSPAGGPWAKDAEGNPVATNADGVAVQGQTPAALHQANAAQARKATAPPGTQPPGAPQPGAVPAPGGALPPPGAQAAAAQPPQQQPPVPVATTPPPQQVAQVQAPPPGGADFLNDATLGGKVPQAFIAKYGAANAAGQYERWLNQSASGLKMNPATAPMADAFEKEAAQVADLYKNQQTLAMRFGAPAAGARAEEEAKAKLKYAGPMAAAEEQAKAPYQMVETQPTPGGPTMMVPKSSVLNPGPGGENAAIAKQPEAFAKGQNELMANDNAQVQQYQARQVARQRLQSISKILQNYEPGAFAEQKADLATGFASLGFPVPPAALQNAASFQEFTKNTIANVFSDVKSMGGRPLVSEISGLSKGAANPSLQPQANQAILGQGMGLLDYYDQHANDYFGWRKGNPYASNSADFEIPWIKKHTPISFVDSATKNVAVKGIPIPPDPAKRVVGQLYVGPKGVGRWMGNGWQIEGGQ